MSADTTLCNNRSKLCVLVYLIRRKLNPNAGVVVVRIPRAENLLKIPVCVDHLADKLNRLSRAYQVCIFFEDCFIVVSAPSAHFHFGKHRDVNVAKSLITFSHHISLLAKQSDKTIL